MLQSFQLITTMTIWNVVDFPRRDFHLWQLYYELIYNNIVLFYYLQG
mgnify:CR=1 FL=1